MWLPVLRLICYFLGFAALIPLQGCGGDEAAKAPDPRAPKATLTATWATGPSAKKRPFGVLLIEPSDAIAAKGRVEDPTRGETVFTYRRARPLIGYYLDVRRQYCGEGRCRIYHPIASICTHAVDVEQGETVTATVRLRSRRDCTISLSTTSTTSPGGGGLGFLVTPAVRHLTSAGFTVVPVADADLRVSPARANGAEIALNGEPVAYVYAFRSAEARRKAQLKLLADRDVTEVVPCNRFALTPLTKLEAGDTAERLDRAMSGTQLDCDRSIVE